MINFRLIVDDSIFFNYSHKTMGEDVINGQIIRGLDVGCCCKHGNNK